MKRREFIKGSVVLAAAALGPSILSATPVQGNGVRRFRVDMAFDIRYDEKAYPAKLWIPLPLDAAWQKVKEASFSGDYDDSNYNTKNLYGARTLYAEWKKSPNPKRVHLSMEIETRTRTVPIAAIEAADAKSLPIPEEVKLYLQPTAHIPVTGRVEVLAKKITGSQTRRFEKVKRIYDWTTRMTFRDPKVKGCGTGDVEKMLESGYYGGKCTDLSSLFVALLRAAGIPAREVFGIRLGKSTFSKALGKSDAKGFADITTWQHCRAEYFIPGIGWIPSDPADITKLELVEKLSYDNPRVQALKRRYLHSWEMNWMAFNHARDFKLWPTPEQYPLNMFGYPYAEIEDEVLDYYDPKNFSYRITSQEL